MNTRRAFIVFAFVVSLCVCALLFLNPATVSSIAAYAFIRRGNIKTILYWNQFSGDYSFYLGEGYVAQNCPRFNNCFATHSRFIQSVDSFDAIVFHHGIHDELTYRDLPTSRRPEQKYVFVALKSPANQYISNRFNNLFNATMTYQLNSDIIWTYADMIDLAEEQMVAVPSRTEFKWKTIDSGYEEKDIVEELEEEQLIRKIIAKRKLAVWYRNNCETPSNRENYVAELEKYAPIDKYGKCSDDSTNCLKDADCFKTHVEPNYFFYLAFEDSLCDDYVTETLYNALK
ncbi:alpha-(1,3)-fucosyltransferase C-like [Phymastichus coffea]|nr:alpha-(1,3)-fucosyltransferase C-like [Phymastichus coffea]